MVLSNTILWVVGCGFPPLEGVHVFMVFVVTRVMFHVQGGMMT